MKQAKSITRFALHLSVLCLILFMSDVVYATDWMVGCREPYTDDVYNGPVVCDLDHSEVGLEVII